MSNNGQHPTADDGSKAPEPEAHGHPHDRLDAVGDLLDMFEDRLDRQAEAIDEIRTSVRTLERRFDELDERTDLLGLVDDVDSLNGRERSEALLEHLQREARTRERGGGEPIATIDRSGAERALHYPDIDRTTFYDDMRRVERWIGDREVCRYDGGDLRLDLTSVPRSLEGCGARQQISDSSLTCGGSTTGSVPERGETPVDTAHDSKDG